jgi:hypothetical protein
MGGLGHSAVATLPCFASLGHLTADKRLRYAPPKLPSATSFIRKTLYEIPNPAVGKGKYLPLNKFEKQEVIKI